MTDALPLQAIAGRLQESVGELREVRERHLNAAVNEELDAMTRVLADPCWPSLGRSGVDVAIGGDQPTLVAELKWCRLAQDKIYEAIWNLFKVANLAHRRGCEAYLITGATERTWKTTWCGDLFEEGTHSPTELCGRRFPRGTRWLAWDDLLFGGKQRAPDCVPTELKLTEPRRVSISDSCGT